MKTTCAVENAEKLSGILAQLKDGQSPLRVTFLYENETTRGWARESCEQIKALVGNDRLQATWWRITELNDAGVLAGAVSTAMHADLVVVATEATEGLPLAFYVWINGWTPHRMKSTGALVALLGRSMRGNSRSGRVADYLRAAASNTRMHFLKHTDHAISELKTLAQAA